MRTTRAPIGVSAAKLLFFDKKVTKGVSRARKRVLSKFGAYVRSDAKRSMRKTIGRKKKIRRGPRKGEFRRVFEPSKRGTPPKSIKGQLKKFLFFVYDQKKDSVIIGPIILGGNRSSKPVPGLHEHGGKTTVKRKSRGRTFVAKYPRRPYMKPAAKKNFRKLRRLWKGSIKK